MQDLITLLMSLWAAIPLMVKALSAVIAVALVIPGKQPKAFLMRVL